MGGWDLVGPPSGFQSLELVTASGPTFTAPLQTLTLCGANTNTLTLVGNPDLGDWVMAKNIGGGTLVVPSGPEGQIDGSSNYMMSGLYDFVWLVYADPNWYIISAGTT